MISQQKEQVKKSEKKNIILLIKLMFLILPCFIYHLLIYHNTTLDVLAPRMVTTAVWNCAL